jgi:hypothetical protein
MRLLAASSVIPVLLFVFTPAFAIETPRIVPQMHEVHRPRDEVFASLKRYFTDSSLSNFRLVSADEQTHTLVARLTGIGDETWNKWAYCETGPVQMIYKLEDDAVTVTVKLQKPTPHSTFVSVAADFQGTYGLGANQNKVACTSKFVLEDNILAAAGAAPGK